MGVTTSTSTSSLG
ncbi:hypothetical protein E2C01_095249 [Portunus trituberculatus]|uniref:Uncharacterized protein n=1 Tax=Portunus trituberculatus TaxID=210409 RepID=A0A5B7JYA0_PORTR|nr:hypothetical protein [Portunus trituberculatus]